MNYANICDSLFVSFSLFVSVFDSEIAKDKKKVCTFFLSVVTLMVYEFFFLFFLVRLSDFRLISQIKSTLTKLAGILVLLNQNEWWKTKNDTQNANIKVKSFFIFGLKRETDFFYLHWIFHAIFVKQFKMVNVDIKSVVIYLTDGAAYIFLLIKLVFANCTFILFSIEIRMK